MTERASQAPALSRKDAQAPALSQWLQLMLAEIAAKREAEEHARAEEARRRLERAASAPAERRSETHSS
jgi:hypothetical protein